MFAHLTRILTCAASLGLLLVASCGSEPTLISKSAAVPSGVDLSGFWQVRYDPKAPQRSRAYETSDRLIPPGRSHSSRRHRGSSGTSAQVFLEYGESLKITQTDYGIFISYDRAIVEEFTFGENRMVEIGPIEAKRVSGWEGNSFVVETLDTSGTTLFESWRLGSTDSVLVRDIRISKGETDSFKLRQVFDRQ